MPTEVRHPVSTPAATEATTVAAEMRDAVSAPAAAEATTTVSTPATAEAAATVPTPSPALRLGWHCGEEHGGRCASGQHAHDLVTH
jgi:hypothetical protein